VKIIWNPRNIAASIFLIIFGFPLVVLSIVLETILYLCDASFDIVVNIAYMISGRT